MTGPGTSIGAGAFGGLLGAVILEVLGPDAFVAVTFGALGGATRWLAAWHIGTVVRWQRNILAIPLGAVFAFGAISIAAPFLGAWMGVDSESWLKEVLSGPEARRGIAYVLGLFASEILDRVAKKARGADNE